METTLSFLAAATALIASPGPNTLSLAAVSAAFGAKHSLGYMAGLILGMALVIAIVGSGVTGLLLIVPGVAPVITLAAVTYFIYLAVRIAMAPPLSDDGATRLPPSWIAALFVALANPKGYAAIAAMFSGFVLVSDSPLADTMVKATALLSIIVAANIMWLFTGAALTPLFRSPRTNRVVNICFAVALLVSVVAAFLI